MGSSELSLAFVMDPPGSMDIDADTTFVLMLEAQRRGHRIFYVAPGDLGVIDGRPVAVSNISPFTFVWDTRLEADGAHAVVAEALAGGTILAQTTVTLTADNGGPAL